MADRTETSIANMAADFLDSSAIGNINDNFGDSIIWARNYDEAVQTVLAEFNWNAGIARAVINKVTLPIAIPDYASAYAFPTDCLGPLDVDGRPIDQVHWAVETVANLDAHGNVVNRRKIFLCDSENETIVLRYQAMVLPRDMTPHLAKACALELAIRCCGKLTNSTTKMAELRDQFAEATRGTPKRIGGYQVDTRQNRPKPRVQTVTAGQRARMGYDL